MAAVYYYWFHVCRVAEVTFKPTPANLQLRSALGDELDAPFRPLWWAFNTHLQTIVNVTLRTPAKVAYERQVVRLRDGGQTALDWAVESREEDPICMVLTGYTGNSEELEIKILVRQLLEDRFQVCVMHFRGLGNMELSNAKFGDCAPEDVDDVIDAIRQRKGTVLPLLALGVSAGGNALALYAGARGRECRIKALASISNPFQIFATLGVKLKSDFVSRNVYDPFFVPKRRAVVKRHSELFSTVKGFDHAAVDAARGAIEFDKAVSLRTSGFSSIEEFYEARSSGNLLQHIAIPTLFVNAADDPFMDINSFPRSKIRENEHLFGVLTERGGHLGFMNNSGLLGLSNRTWDEVLASKWLKIQRDRLMGDKGGKQQ